MASLTDIMIYNIISDRLLVDMHKVAEPTNQLTAITLSPKMGYFIAGANQGQILIYKMQRYRRLVNAFQSHEKKIIALHVNRLENELLSASEDQTIRIFSLQSMQIL
jgi:WD40 repeat protein